MSESKMHESDGGFRAADVSDSELERVAGGLDINIHISDDSSPSAQRMTESADNSASAAVPADMARPAL